MLLYFSMLKRYEGKSVVIYAYDGLYNNNMGRCGGVRYKNLDLVPVIKSDYTLLDLTPGMTRYYWI